MASFIVEGVETEDGSRTCLGEFDSSGEAIAFMRRYVAHENAGNWGLIEIYDVRNLDESERIKFWERQEE